jgi:hypothetical protein
MINIGLFGSSIFQFGLSWEISYRGNLGDVTSITFASGGIPCGTMGCRHLDEEERLVAMMGRMERRRVDG